MQLPGTLLVIAKQSLRELRKTLRTRENFGIKSLREAPLNERSDGRRPDDENISGYPQGYHNQRQVRRLPSMSEGTETPACAEAINKIR